MLPHKPSSGAGDSSRPGSGSHSARAMQDASDTKMLRLRDRFLRLAGQLANIGAWQLDLTTMRLTWSEEVCRVHELPPEYEPDLDSALSFYPGDARQKIANVVEMAISTGAGWDIELPLITAAGRPRIVRSLGEVESDAHGKSIRIYGVFQDVTDYAKARDAAEQNQARFLHLVGNLPGAVVRFSIVTVDQVSFEFLSPAMESILAVPSHVILANPHVFTDMIFAADAESWKNSLASALTGHQLQWRGRMQRTDGQLRWVDLHAAASAGPDGILFDGYLQDITERRQAELELESAHQRVTTILANVPAAIFRTVLCPDATMRFEFLQVGLSKSGSIHKERMAREPHFARSLVHPEDLASFDAALHAATQGPSMLVWNGRIVPDGEVRYIHIEGRPMLLSDGTPAWDGVILNVTSHMEQEEERRRMNERLTRLQKLEGLSTLAGGVAHDFNNQLMGVLGHLELALMDLPEGHASRSAVIAASSAARRAAEVSRQLLAASGKGRFVLEHIQLSDVGRQVIAILRNSLPKNVNLQVAQSVTPSATVADRGQIQQLMMNLLQNAVESVGDKPGTITVLTGNHHASAAFLETSLVDDHLPPGSYAFLEVIDTGMGMDQETVRRACDPFFSTRGTGRGLGLSAALGIVRGHDGYMRIDSVPGKGTIVRVGFPLHAATTKDPSDQTPSSDRAPDTQLPACRVLIADDEPLVRSAAAHMLRRMGTEPIEASDGAEAITMFDRSPDAFGAAILDLTMPEVGGREVLKHIRRKNPMLPVLIVSGWNESIDDSEFAEGPTAYMQKPFRMEQLAAALGPMIRDRLPTPTPQGMLRDLSPKPDTRSRE